MGVRFTSYHLCMNGLQALPLSRHPCTHEVPIKLKVKVRKSKILTSESEEIELPVLLPHDIINYLFTEVGLDIPSEAVRQFWHVVRDLGREPWAVASPASTDHIPLAIYGDSCQVKGGEKLMGIFLSLPLWRPKSTRCSRFLMVAIEENRLFGAETCDTIMACLVTSINQLFDGMDRDGRPLAHGRCFTITEMRGDWLYHKLVWQFSSRWNRLKDICYLCDCKGRSRNEKELFWRVDGEWHEYDKVDFLLTQLGHRERPCALFYMLTVVPSPALIEFACYA